MAKPNPEIINEMIWVCKYSEGIEYLIKFNKILHSETKYNKQNAIERNLFLK